MNIFRVICLVVLTFILTWFLAGSSISAQSQGGSQLVRLVGLGQFGSIPTDASGTPYLPTRDDRQMIFSSENWQNAGEVMPLLLNSSLLPKQVTICGNRLSMIQASLKNNPNEESLYFPVTVNGTRTVVPDEGCYSITPVAFLRIKGIGTMSRAQLPYVTVWARY